MILCLQLHLGEFSWSPTAEVNWTRIEWMENFWNTMPSSPSHQTLYPPAKSRNSHFSDPVSERGHSHKQNPGQCQGPRLEIPWRYWPAYTFLQCGGITGKGDLPATSRLAPSIPVEPHQRISSRTDMAMNHRFKCIGILLGEKVSDLLESYFVLPLISQSEKSLWLP